MSYLKDLTKQAFKDFPVSLMQDAIKLIVKSLFFILFYYVTTKVIPKISERISDILNINFFKNANVSRNSKQFEIIKSPSYPDRKEGEDKQKSNFIYNDQDFFLALILYILFNTIIVKFMHENIDLVTNIMKIYAVLPVFPVAIIAIKSSICKVIQEISIKFIIISLITSIVTYKYGSNLYKLLPYLSTNSFADISNSMIILLGLFTLIVQHLISYLMLLRVINVFMNRKFKTKHEIIEKILEKTNGLERLSKTLFLIIFYNILSYLLVSGRLMNLFKNLNFNY